MPAFPPRGKTASRAAPARWPSTKPALSACATRLAYALLLAALATGCTATADGTSSATSDVINAERGDLRDQIKAACEGDRTFLENETDTPFDTLPGKAREAFND